MVVFKVPGDDGLERGDESVNAPLLPGGDGSARSNMVELEELEQVEGMGGVKGTLMDGIANVG